jgi:thiamine-monophosphate kinase
MREGELLARIYGRSAGLAGAFPQVLVGPGDDCAVVTVGGTSLLLKTDQLIEGRHFVSGTPLELVGRKAVARAVSDIAAMGGRPVAALAACALPRGFSGADALFDACYRWAEKFGAPLVGGDIASFATEGAALTLTITVLGEPHAERGPVLRSGARAGDEVYVTGEIGGSFDAATGCGKHLEFVPRVQEGWWLAGTLGRKLCAMMDVSDGLGMDAGRLAVASGVGVELENVEACLSGEILRRAESPPPRGVVLGAVADGEDYELLFVVEAGTEVPAVCPATGTRITRVGVCVEGNGAYLRIGGERVEVSGRGWEHA